jgi:iron(III) transport system permease protein
MIDPHSAELYAPNRGAAMALIFTLIVLLIGYGLQAVISRRGIARTATLRRRRNTGSATPPATPPATPTAIETTMALSP